MSSSSLNAKFIYTVRTIDGIATTHTYDLQSPESAKALMEEMAEEIVDALWGDKPMIIFDSPIISYNARHVVSIQFEVIGGDEYQALLISTRRRIGFRK